MAKLDWNPIDFDNVVRFLNRDPSSIHPTITYAIQTMGELTCPSPPWHSDGHYRVGLGATGTPEIQVQESEGTWAPAALKAKISD